MQKDNGLMAELERLDRFLNGDEPGVRPIDMMREDGMEIPPDDVLDDQQVHTKLWEIIRKLGSLGFFLDDTDHLSDRELYRFLVTDALLVEEVLPGPRDFQDISPVCDCCEAAHETYLRYYADDEWREMWERDHGGPIPDREPLPFDRDRLLPGPEERVFGPPDA